MRTKITSYLAAIGCGVLIASTAIAQDNSASPSVPSKFDIFYVSKYIWRGAVLSDEPCVQPSLTLNTPSGLSYNLWMSSSMEENGTVVEHDHTINYAFTLGKYALNTGYIYYAFPSTSFKSTQELYGSICLGGQFSSTLSVNYDFDEVDGAYLALSSGYSCAMPFSKSPDSVMNLSAKIGFGTGSYNKNTYAAPDKAALLDMVISANTTYSIGKSISLTPSVTYSAMVDSDIRDAVAEPDNFIAGLTLSSTF